MKTIEIIFNEQKPERPKVVTFSNVAYRLEAGCLVVTFSDAKDYIYPLHTIDRVKAWEGV